MHWTNTYIAGIGTAFGDPLTVEDAVRAGLCSFDVGEATGQISVGVAAAPLSVSGLAIDATWTAIRRADLYSEAPAESFGPLFHARVAPTDEDVATRVYAALDLPPTSHPVTTISAGRNGAIHGLAAAATYLQHTEDTVIENAFVTAAAAWPAPSFDRWASADSMPLGDGGGAMIVSRRPARAQLLSTVTRTDPGLRILRDTNAFEHEIHCRTSNLVQLALAEALEDAPLDGGKVRYVITPFELSSVPRSAYRSWAICDDEQLDPFVKHGRTTGHLGAADLICGLDLVDGSLAPIDDGDLVVLLADDGSASAAAAVIRF